VRPAVLTLSAGPLLALTQAVAAAPACHATDGRARIPAGVVLFGEDGPDRPGRAEAVPAYAIDRHEVTNRQFARFARTTGYRTEAERNGGGAVFVAPGGPVPLDDPRRWWRYVRGADWRHPRGPGSSLPNHPDEPVVQVTLADAEAYARWAGGSLPTERQWERAARGNQIAPRDPHAWASAADGSPRANIHTGRFPDMDDGADGHAGLGPVGCFPPNSFGVYDMIGNAWEWVSGTRSGSGRVKGGSFLCSAHYCSNFRPAAFQAQEEDLPTSHIGFRIAYIPPKGRHSRSGHHAAATHARSGAPGPDRRTSGGSDAPGRAAA
jgi:formylglycine-generating enzyme required for sulfatase activity